MPPDLSIIVTQSQRPELLAYSLESVRRARGWLALEVIVVDDGLTPPLDPALPALRQVEARVIRQEGQGPLFARLRGLKEATGHYTLFLDAADLIGPEKLTAQVTALESSRADVSYTDTASCVLEGGYDALVIQPDPPLRDTADAAKFFISLRPAPHNPIWRTDFLRAAVAGTFFQPSALYNHVAEMWFHHHAAVLPGRVIKVPGPHTIIGQHPEARRTNHWESLGVASLAVKEAFARRCPNTEATAAARQLVAEEAFRSWRSLPRGFSAAYLRRLLGVWRRLRVDTRRAWLGGPLFQNLSRGVGVVNAGRILRMRNASYESCRTLDDDALETLLLKLPPA